MFFPKFLRRKEKHLKTFENSNDCDQTSDLESDCDTLLVQPSFSEEENDDNELIESNNSSLILSSKRCNYPNCCSKHMFESLHKNYENPSCEILRDRRLDLYFKKYPPKIAIQKINTAKIKQYNQQNLFKDTTKKLYHPTPIVPKIQMVLNNVLNRIKKSTRIACNKNTVVRQSSISTVLSNQTKYYSAKSSIDSSYEKLEGLNFDKIKLFSRSPSIDKSSGFTCSEAFNHSIWYTDEILNVNWESDSSSCKFDINVTVDSLNWITKTDSEPVSTVDRNFNKESNTGISKSPSIDYGKSNNLELTNITALNDSKNNEDLTIVTTMANNSSIEFKKRLNGIFEMALELNSSLGDVTSYDSSSICSNSVLSNKTLKCISKLPRIYKKAIKNNLN